MNAVVQAGSFEDRIIEKIKTDIGSLMTEEELKNIVAASIERIFFKEREDRDSYGHKRYAQPSIFQEAVQNALDKQFREIIAQYVKDNESLFTGALEVALNKGFTTMIQQWFDQKVQSIMYDFSEKLKQGMFR